jgi:acetoacetyl-CoA synthetase
MKWMLRLRRVLSSGRGNYVPYRPGSPAAEVRQRQRAGSSPSPACNRSRNRPPRREVSRAAQAGARRLPGPRRTAAGPLARPGAIPFPSPVPELLWQPSVERIERARLTAFRRRIEERHGVSLPDTAALHRWSLEELPAFWAEIWQAAGVVRHAEPDRVVDDPTRLPGARWFEGARLNYAENLLRHRGDAPAVTFVGEAGERRCLSRDALRRQVARAAAALRDAGVVPGDRVAGFLPCLPEAVVAFLASASLGAIWSSCSPDFGTDGVVDRFGQIEPRLLVAADGYRYNGRTFDSRPVVAEMTRRMPSLEHVVVVPCLEATPNLAGVPGAVAWPDWLGDGPAPEPDYTPLPFDHPLYILYSSGTTGAPKCIVHGAGGILLQHWKEHALHTDLGEEDRLFYFTTCGWMMWNWLVGALFTGAGIVCYDGSPFHPHGGRLFELADREQVTVFGTSARFLAAAEKAGVRPRETLALERLRGFLSTGSPLPPEGFRYVYREVKQDLCLSSVSGGTDICSCFFAGDPTGPVYAGELQCPGLGMAVEAWSPDGRPLQGEKGELVCTRACPSMPVGFWNDPDGARYRAAYFERFPGVWHHGDYVELTPRGGAIVYGRSDTTLNPSGVRIGTAEIYRPVETLAAIEDSLVVGQEWDGDVRVVLFVKLRTGETLDEELAGRIRALIRERATPRHVPARILAVDDIPYTRSGKKVELAVRDVVHGRPVSNREAIANPEALDHFRERPELSN